MPRHFAPACIFCASLLFAAAPLLALDDLSFISSREKSMGGRHVALADDSSVLLANPTSWPTCRKPIWPPTLTSRR